MVRSEDYYALDGSHWDETTSLDPTNLLPAGYTFADYSSGGQQLSGRTYDANGNLTSASGRNSSGATWSENLNGDNSTFTFNGQTFGGPQFTSGAGLTLGSTIGGILGGNSIAARIVGSTVIGALGQSVGTALALNGLGIPLLGNGATTSLLDDAVRSTINNFGGDLAVNAVGNIAGGFSSLLFGEAAHALGLNGFAAGLFTTVGTSITSQLATNLGAMTLNSLGVSTTLTAGFSPEAFVGNIGGAIGGFFGSYLAAEIVPPTGIASSIGGRIGGAIGGFLASEIPVVGTFFGSLVGSVLGTLVGGLFDPHIVPWSSEMVGAVNGVLGINYWNWNGGGNPQEFTSLANMVAGNANQVLALTRRDPNIMNITGLTSINELVFNQLGSTLTAIYPDGNSTNFYVDGMPQWFALQALYNTSEIATYELVQHATLVGSDPITTGALAAARVQDTTTPAVYADLRVAQDYERYRANAEIINTAMAANPQSDFTAGWNLTLLRAQGLGLDQIAAQPGWTADLTDNHETVRDANGNVVQQLTFNADGTVTSSQSTSSAGSVQINNVSTLEGQGGTHVLTFTVTRNGGLAPFSVNYATADATASATASDYVPSSGTLSFGMGVNAQTVSVTIQGDINYEPDESFLVNLTGATNNATIAVGRGTGTIVNDDQSNSDFFGWVTHDPNSAGGEVYEFYEGLLGRAPDPLGFEYRVSDIQGGLSLHDTAQQILASPEFTSRFGGYTQLSSQQFIDDMYQGVLHRTPVTQEEQGWVGALSQGWSREDVAVAFVTSAEHQSRLQSTFNAGIFVPDPVDDQVARLYYGILNRAPDAAGLLGWENAAHNGTSLQAIAQGFISSPEYQATHGATDQQFVDSLYQGALGRFPASSEEQGWVGAVSQIGRVQVALGIAESVEANSHLAPNIEYGFRLF